MNTFSFRGAAEQVIQMNSLFREKHLHLDETMIKNQMGYTISELDELLHAIQQNDTKEMVDAIGDTFVTGVYQAFLLCQDRDEFYDLIDNAFNNIKVKINNPVDVLNEFDNLKKNVLNNNKELIVSGLIAFLKWLDYDNVIDRSLTNSERVLWEIDKSNFTKFPHKDSKTEQDIKEDLDFIQNYLMKKGESDSENPIELDYVIYKNRITYFRKDNKKFLKPKTFVEPNLQWANENKYLTNLCNEVHKYYLTVNKEN